MPTYRLAGHVVSFEPHFEDTLSEMQAYRYTGARAPETTFTVTREAYEQTCRDWLNDYASEIEGYLLSRQFYAWLLSHGASYIHGNAFEMDGWGYLLSADSGTGKSTHCCLWKQRFGAERVHVLNDDKPFVRFDEQGGALVCGSPWCGKVPAHQNAEAPLAGVCLLRQGKENRIRRVAPDEAAQRLLRQLYLPDTEQAMDQALRFLDRLVHAAPVYELSCNISEAAAELAYRTLCPDAKGERL